MAEDPAYPGADGDSEGQCCNCGEEVPIELPPFVCRGFVVGGRDRCLHVVCQSCLPEIDGDAGICPCTHETDSEGFIFVDPSVGPRAVAAAPAPQEPLLELLRAFKNTDITDPK